MGYSGARGKLKIIEDKNVTQPSEDKNTKDKKCIWLLKKMCTRDTLRCLSLKKLNKNVLPMTNEVRVKNILKANDKKDRQIIS